MALQQLRGRVVRLDGGDAPAPPKKVRLFKFGKVDTTKGVFLFDKKSAESVMKTWSDYGNDLCFDYEHKAVDPDARAGDGKAAGWFKLAIGIDGLYAVDIRWTSQAAKQITSREWRYFSPTFEYESESGRILELVNVALTNIPATKDLPPLVAARKAMPTKTNKVVEVRTPKKGPKKTAKLGVKKTTKTSEVTEYSDDAATDELDDASDEGDSSDEMSALDDGAELDGADLDDGAELDDAELDDGELDDAALDGDPDDSDMPMKSKKTSRNGSAAVRAVAAVERFSRENAMLNRRLAALEARERNTRVRDLVEGAIEAGKVLPAEREFLTAAGRSDIKSLRVYLSKRTGSGVKLGKKHEAPQLDAAIDAASVPEAGKMLAQLGNAKTYEDAKKAGTLANFDPRAPMKLERN